MFKLPSCFDCDWGLVDWVYTIPSGKPGTGAGTCLLTIYLPPTSAAQAQGQEEISGAHGALDIRATVNY